MFLYSLLLSSYSSDPISWFNIHVSMYISSLSISNKKLLMLSLADTFNRMYKPNYCMTEIDADKMLTQNLSLR